MACSLLCKKGWMHTVLEHAQTIFGRAYKTLVLSLPKEGEGDSVVGMQGRGTHFFIIKCF